MQRPFILRDYQRDCVDEVQRRNVLAVLPTNSGKTVIAAERIRLTLEAEETKKVIFLAPYSALARQQASLLLRHVGKLHLQQDDAAAAERTDARGGSASWSAGFSKTPTTCPRCRGSARSRSARRS